MASTFDYKDFAQDLTRQAEEIIPNDIAQQHKKEFLEKIYNFTYIAGEAFSKDETIESADTAKILTQIISEWTFHKYIDLIRANIPSIYHESILQKLAFVAYEMAREAAIGNLSQDEMLKLVEVQLNKAYEKTCKQLLDNKQITQEIYNNAITYSNVDMMPKTDVKKKINTLYYTVCAFIFAIIVVGVNVFGYEYQHLDVVNTISLVVLSMYIGFYFTVKHYNKLIK